MVNALLNLKISIEHIEAEFEAANQAEFEAEIAAECEAFKASAIAVPEGTAVPEANTEPASSSTNANQDPPFVPFVLSINRPSPEGW